MRLVPLLRDRVSIGSRRNAVVKGGIEDRHLRHIRLACHGHLDAQQVGRIVQRRKGREPPNGLDHTCVDQTGFAKGFTPVNDSVSDPEQLACIPSHARVSEQTCDSVDSFCMVREVARVDLLAKLSGPIPLDMHESASRLADALGGASCEQSPLAHVEELVLE